MLFRDLEKLLRVKFEENETEIPDDAEMPDHYFDFCYGDNLICTCDGHEYHQGCKEADESDIFDMLIMILMQAIIAKEE